jgi:histidine triad (HIT) family protein
MSTCVFCDRIARDDYDFRVEDVVTFEPLDAVVPGHRLFVPVQHVETALTTPWLTGHVQHVAASSTGGHGNFIWNVGASAGQSIMHAHLHWVPRTPGDGIAMPRTAQQAALATVGGAA